MEQYTGPIGLLIILLIGIATVLLILNMNKRIKRLPREFPDQERPPADREP
jgi:F0F1-type ATP synthase assembly protein I